MPPPSDKALAKEWAAEHLRAGYVIGEVSVFNGSQNRGIITRLHPGEGENITGHEAKYLQITIHKKI